MARLSADIRRGQLVEAAIRVMVRDGIARATTRAIAAEAGMPLGFFHYCFRSKQELLQTVMETLIEHSWAAATEVAGGKATAREALLENLQGYWAHVEANPEEHLLTYELTQFALREPGFEEAARRQYEAYLAAHTRYLEAVADATRTQWALPLPVLARLVHSAVEGITLLWLVERDGEKAWAVLSEHVDHLAGLAKPKRAARAAK